MSTTASASSAPVAPLPSTVGAVLHLLLSLQARRSVAYSRFHDGFRNFMTDRETYEMEEAAQLERKAKESTLLVKQAQQAKDKAVAATASAPTTENSTSASTSSPSTAVTDDASTLISAQDQATLKSIHSANEAEERLARPNPEKIFQTLCAEIMAEFQAVSGEVRKLIAHLRSTTSPVPPVALANHYATLMQSLQMLEKYKLEVTIHQQMLKNQRYVLAHPKAHGQLQEHSHHIHSVTDEKGRVRQHPKHKHGENGSSCSSHHHDHSQHSIKEEEDEQELEDNAQPFTRHLSALLSDTAFETKSPFLFPPSGAAPDPVALPSLPTKDSTLMPPISEESEEKYHREMKELREQEFSLIEKINQLLEEVRFETMEGEGATDDNEDTE